MRLSVLLALVFAGCDDRPAERELGCERPLVFGYRGAGDLAPENTLPAFEAGVLAGADGIEVDVRMTSDGVLVAFHDESTQRTSDAPDTRFIPEMTWEEVRELDVGAWFGPEYAGTRVPSIAEAIEAIPPPVRILLDLKADDVLAPLAALVEESGIQERALASSFSATRLERFRALLSDVPLVFCMGEREDLEVAPTAARYALLPHGVRASHFDLDEVERRRFEIALPDSATTDDTAWRASFIVAGDPSEMASRISPLRPSRCPE